MFRGWDYSQVRKVTDRFCKRPHLVFPHSCARVKFWLFSAVQFPGLQSVTEGHTHAVPWSRKVDLHDWWLRKRNNNKATLSHGSNGRHFWKEWCARHGVAFLQSKHLGGVGNRVGDSRPASPLSQVETSLSYMDPTSKEMKENITPKETIKGMMWFGKH